MKAWKLEVRSSFIIDLTLVTLASRQQWSMLAVTFRLYFGFVTPFWSCDFVLVSLAFLSNSSYTKLIRKNFASINNFVRLQNRPLFSRRHKKFDIYSIQNFFYLWIKVFNLIESFKTIKHFKLLSQWVNVISMSPIVVGNVVAVACTLKTVRIALLRLCTL